MWISPFDELKLAMRSRSRDAIRRARALLLAKLRLLSIAETFGAAARGLRRTWKP